MCNFIQVNGAELGGCNIKYSDSRKGFGIFASTETSDGIYYLHSSLKLMMIAHFFWFSFVKFQMFCLLFHLIWPLPLWEFFRTLSWALSARKCSKTDKLMTAFSSFYSSLSSVFVSILLGSRKFFLSLSTDLRKLKGIHQSWNDMIGILICFLLDLAILFGFLMMTSLSSTGLTCITQPSYRSTMIIFSSLSYPPKSSNHID